MNYVLLVLGVVLLAFGLIAGIYSVTETDEYFGGVISDEEIIKPYEDYAIPLTVGGVVLIIVSVFLPKPRKNN